MALRSSQKEAYMASLPRAGFEGTVKNFLKGGKLEGKARLKSGSMNQVRSYAGYIEANNRKYAVAIIVNNFQCRQSKMKMEIEQLLLALF
jgi:D-alanyl-D-alanine carboxypeptidase/D-alanyl-D-alanine-endopeptidase (penicillin-binding protein 4)